MVQAMEGAMDGITKQSKEIWVRKLSKERSGCCRSKHTCNWKEAYCDDSDDDDMMIIGCS